MHLCGSCGGMVYRHASCFVTACLMHPGLQAHARCSTRLTAGLRLQTAMKCLVQLLVTGH